MVKPPLIYDPAINKDRGFRIMLSDSAPNLQKEQLVIRVPYQKNPYPIDYSIIYQNRLVSLFAKFYEDDRYVAFSTCQGEFGGALFFYDKQTRLTHFTPSVCTVSVTQRPTGYYVLASLGHGMGSADLRVIENPSALPILKRMEQGIRPEVDSTRLRNVVMPTVVFDQYNCQFFGGFVRNGKLIYIVNWGERTFLAEVDRDTIFIKDPLFNDDLYTHDPVTTTYSPNLTLINLDFYGIGREREIACLLFRGNQVIKIDWNLTNKRTR